MNYLINAECINTTLYHFDSMTVTGGTP